MADNLVLGFILGVTAYVSLDIGKGIQKYAIEGFKGKSGAKKNTGPNFTLAGDRQTVPRTWGIPWSCSGLFPRKLGTP